MNKLATTTFKEIELNSLIIHRFIRLLLHGCMCGHVLFISRLLC